jgi:hypothetical protein
VVWVWVAMGESLLGDIIRFKFGRSIPANTRT